jgi:dephospho-CoA kinase
MKVIGLTGGIGSGKSTILQYLAELGAIIMDADKVGHEVFQPGTEGWNDVVATFGKEVIDAAGEVDRKKLGEIVFNSPEALHKLNQIVHPRAHEIAKSRLNEYRQQGVEVVVFEVILLIEAGWTDLVNEVWVAVADEDTVVKRLKRQRGMSEEEILARIHSQMTQEEWIKHADVVVENNGDIDELKAKVKELWEKLKNN